MINTESNYETILLSIIVPLYKGKDHIIKTVDEILKIKLDKEIIIVNDGSPDDSVDICNARYSNTKDVIIINKENGGIASARNTGLDVAKGQYVMFCDQDDIVVPETVEKAVCGLLEKDAQIAFWSTKRIYQNGQIRDNTTITRNIVIPQSKILDDVLPSFLYKKSTELQCDIGPIWGALFERKLIEDNKIRFKCFVSYEDDHLFLFDVLLVTNTIYMIPEVGYYWNIFDNSFSHKKRVIPDYVTKLIKSYEYRLDGLKKASGNKIIVEEYSTYVRQSIILNSIYNVCTYYNNNGKEKKQIKKLLLEKEYRDAFETKTLMINDNYASLIYYLVRKKKVVVAFFVAYFNSLRLRLK